MTVIINLGMAGNFADIDFKGLARLFPGIMRVDYVRIYQGESDEMGCDPTGYPTTQYIADHPEPYLNANLTKW